MSLGSLPLAMEIAPSMSSALSSLVLYTGPDHPIRPRLEAGLRPLVHSRAFQAYRTLSGLTRRLRRPGGLRDDLVVLCPVSLSELHTLETIRPLLISTHRVVLILPDRSRETVAAGHAFYPRYIGFADDNLEDVFAVLQRLLGRSAVPGRPSKTGTGRNPKNPNERNAEESG